MMLFTYFLFAVMRVIKLYCRTCAKIGNHENDCPDRSFYPPAATLLEDSQYIDSVTIDGTTITNEECDEQLVFKANNLPAFDKGRSLVMSKTKSYWSRTPRFAPLDPNPVPIADAPAGPSDGSGDAPPPISAPASIPATTPPVTTPANSNSTAAASAMTNPLVPPPCPPIMPTAPYPMYGFPPYPYPHFYNPGFPGSMPPGFTGSMFPPPTPFWPSQFMPQQPPVQSMGTPSLPSIPPPYPSIMPPISAQPTPLPTITTPAPAQPSTSQAVATSLLTNPTPDRPASSNAQSIPAQTPANAPAASSAATPVWPASAGSITGPQVESTPQPLVSLEQEWNQRHAAAMQGNSAMLPGPSHEVPTNTGVYTPAHSALPAGIQEKLDLALLKEIQKFDGDKTKFRAWKHQIEQLRPRYESEQFLAIIKAKLDSRPTEYMLTLGSRALDPDTLLQDLAKKYCKYAHKQHVITDFDKLSQGSKSLSDHHIEVHSLLEALGDTLNTVNPHILFGYIKSLSNYSIRLKLNRSIHNPRRKCTLEDLMLEAESEEIVRRCTGTPQDQKSSRPAHTVAAGKLDETSTDEETDASAAEEEEDPTVSYAGKKFKGNGNGKKPFRSGKGWENKKGDKRQSGSDKGGDRKRYKPNNPTSSNSGDRSKPSSNPDAWCIIHCTSDHDWRDCRDKDITQCKYCGKDVKAGELFKHIPHCHGLTCTRCDKVGHSTKKHDTYVMRQKLRFSQKKVAAAQVNSDTPASESQDNSTST